MSSLLGSLFIIWRESVLRAQQTLAVLCELGHLALRPLDGTTGYSELSFVILVVHVKCWGYRYLLAFAIAFIQEDSCCLVCLVPCATNSWRPGVYPGRCHGMVAPLALFSRHLLLDVAGGGRLKWSSSVMWSNHMGSPAWGRCAGSDNRSKRRINVSGEAAWVC